MNLPPDVLGMFAPQFCNWKCKYPVLYVVPVPSSSSPVGSLWTCALTSAR